jgi:hypothetical protein
VLPAEARLPEVVLQHHHRRAAALSIVVGGEHAADERLDAKYVKEVGGDPPGLDQLATVGSHEAEPLRVLAGQPAEDGVLIAEGHVHRIRKRVEAIAVLRSDPAALHPELHQLAWVLDGQEAKDDLIQEREDRRVCGDPERERQDRGGGESRVEPQQANAVLKILKEWLDESRVCHGRALNRAWTILVRRLVAC